jgi:hypothetical protein
MKAPSMMGLFLYLIKTRRVHKIPLPSTRAGKTAEGD